MMQDYDEYRQSRIAYLRAQADKYRLKAQCCLGDRDALAQKMGNRELVVITVPEPGAAGEDMRRLRKLTDQAAAMKMKAGSYESRALAVEKDDSISFDDPDALEKVCNMLKMLSDHQRCMLEVNRMVRTHRKVEFLALEGATEALWEQLVTPNLIGATGITPERLRYNLRQMARLRKRKAELEQLAGWQRAETTLNGIRLIENPVIRRVQLKFPGRLIKQVRKELWADYRLSWYRPEGAWQRKLTAQGVDAAWDAMQYYATTENDIYENNKRTEKKAHTRNSTYHQPLLQRAGWPVPVDSYLVREGGGKE